MDQRLATMVLDEFTKRNQGTPAFDKFQAQFNQAAPEEKIAVLGDLARKYEISFTPDAPAPVEPSAIQSAALKVADQLPMAGAVAGGLVGGTSGALATAGLSTPVAAVAGAAAGGSLGTSFKNAIYSLLKPEEAPKSIGEGLASATQGAVEGASTEMGGQVIGAAAGLAAKGLSKVATKIGFSAIPKAEKLVAKIGGESKIDKVAQLLDDYSITTSTHTLGGMADELKPIVNEVGKELEKGYALVDENAVVKFQVKPVADQIINELDGIYRDIDQSLGRQEERQALRKLFNYVDKNGVISHFDLTRAARTLEGNMYDKAVPEAVRTLNVHLGRAIRKVNGELAKQAAPELAPYIRNLSSTYHELTTVRSHITGLLRKGESPVETISKVAKTSLASKVGGAVGGALALVNEASKFAPIRTSAAATAKYGAQLLSLAPNLGPVGKSILRVAASRGVDAAVKLHANELMKNDKYRKTFNDLGGIKLDENIEQ